MTNVSNQFFSSDADKDTLHRRIIPSQEHEELQQERWNDLRDYLLGELKDLSGYPISSWLQGSYKFRTQIRPPRMGGEVDIDLGVYFEWPGGATAGRYSSLELKTFVQRTLVKYQSEVDEKITVDTPPKTRCCRIRFPEGFHIDVPAYHLDRDRDVRSLATQQDEWEDSDPKALVVWFQYKFPDDVTQVRRLIRYLKMWSCLHLANGDPPSSVMLTILVSEAYSSLKEDGLDGDDLALRNVVASIVSRLSKNSSVPNPVNTGENLNRLSPAATAVLIRNLSALVETADRAFSAATETEASTIWAEVFEHFFPAPSEVAATAAGKSIVRVRFDPDISVTAVSKANSNIKYHGTNRIGPIVRGCSITFTLANANQLPAGATVSWTVRNQDTEAEFVNDMGHLVGASVVTTDESSAYKGTHFMDVLVKSAYGEILGYKRVPVEITGIFAPPRNPKKPGFVKFRSRR